MDGMIKQQSQQQRVEHRAGLVRFGGGMLERLLQLPPNHEVVNAFLDNSTMEIVLVVRGDSMPSVEVGAMIQQVHPTVSQFYGMAIQWIAK